MDDKVVNSTLLSHLPNAFWNCSQPMWEYLDGNTTMQQDNEVSLVLFQWAAIAAVLLNTTSLHSAAAQLEIVADQFEDIFSSYVMMMAPATIFLFGGIVAIGSGVLFFLDLLQMRRKVATAKSFLSSMHCSPHLQSSLLTKDEKDNTAEEAGDVADHKKVSDSAEGDPAASLAVGEVNESASLIQGGKRDSRRNSKRKRAQASSSRLWYPLEKIRQRRALVIDAALKAIEEVKKDRRFEVRHFKEFSSLRFLLVTGSFLSFPGTSERLLKARQAFAFLWCLFPFIDAIALGAFLFFFGASSQESMTMASVLSTSHLVIDTCYPQLNASFIENNKLLNNGSIIPPSCNVYIDNVSLTDTLYLQPGRVPFSVAGIPILKFLGKNVSADPIPPPLPPPDLSSAMLAASSMTPQDPHFGACCAALYVMGSGTPFLVDNVQRVKAFLGGFGASVECALKKGLAPMAVASILLMLGLLQNLFSFFQGKKVTMMEKGKDGTLCVSYADWLLHNCLHSGEFTCTSPAEVPIAALRTTKADLERVRLKRALLRRRSTIGASIMWGLSFFPFAAIIFLIGFYDSLLGDTESTTVLVIDLAVFIFAFSFFGSSVVTLSINALFMNLCEAHVLQLRLFTERLVEYAEVLLAAEVAERSTVLSSSSATSEREGDEKMPVFYSLADVTTEYGRIVTLTRITFKRFNVFLYGTLAASVVVIVAILFGITVVSQEYSGIFAVGELVAIFPFICVVCLVGGALIHVARVDAEGKVLRKKLAATVNRGVSADNTPDSALSNSRGTRRSTDMANGSAGGAKRRGTGSPFLPTLAEDEEGGGLSPVEGDKLLRSGDVSSGEDDDRSVFEPPFHSSPSSIEGLMALQGHFISFHPSLRVLGLTVDLRLFVRGGTLLVTVLFFLIRQRDSIDTILERVP